MKWHSCLTDLYIWNCGSVCAGRASARSSSLQTCRYSPIHAGLLCATRPLEPALITQEESSDAMRFRWVLKGGGRGTESVQFREVLELVWRRRTFYYFTCGYN